MIISSSLCSTPFVSSTDATRLQMASKQLSQTVTHINCKRPLIIGSNWRYLTDTTKFYRYQSTDSGEILYTNDDLMIVLYDNTQELKIIEVPEYLHTSYRFATKLRFKRPVGSFEKNEILYEYDNFIDGVPSYGYNLNSMFFPFFGINFEDCVVISESAAAQLKYQKIDKIILPIYSYSLFKMIYPNSKYGFIPEIGQKIDKTLFAIEVEPIKNGQNVKSILRSFNINDFSGIVNDPINFNQKPIISKLSNAKVQNIKIHLVGKRHALIDKNLQNKLELIKQEYFTKIKKEAAIISSILGQSYTEKLFRNYYILESIKNNDINISSSNNELIYMIEIDIVKEEETNIGDKLSNRYAGKGVVGLILPDELRPFNTKTKEPIDIILGPLSVYARSNLGIVLEGLLNKTIKYCETSILNHLNPNHTHEILKKLANISKILNNETYSNEINSLANNIKINNNLFHNFLLSVKKGGMYFEIPEFCKTDVYQLQQYIKNEFDISTNDSITIKKELFVYIKQMLKIDIEIPENDIIYNNIFNAPMYVLKLKQLTDGKFTVRDVGEYSPASKQPIIDKFGQNKGSHIGYMEFDALIAHNNMYTLREFHNVKSDSSKEIKNNLAFQMTATGIYEMPERSSKSYTKKIIDSLMEFLAKN